MQKARMTQVPCTFPVLESLCRRVIGCVNLWPVCHSVDLMDDLASEREKSMQQTCDIPTKPLMMYYHKHQA